MPHLLQTYLAPRRGGRRGIYSVCSAHPLVIRAAAEQAQRTNSLLLLEATSNQVNQDGGYMGMRPAQYRVFIEQIVSAAGLPLERLILGGDHLGPNPWRHLPAEAAMQKAEILVKEYAAAGFSKIHLDASMSCADDPSLLSDEEIASRAVRLCCAAESAKQTDVDPVYVIGTEVPTPGGATHSLDELQVTAPEAAAHTLEIHKQAFTKNSLDNAWPRVIALVVQPGVEFAHDSVVAYDRAKASSLVRWLDRQGESIVFEAHSTDYQRDNAYAALVEDGFGILKVGPALTFALREALYALEDIERELIDGRSRSRMSQTVERIMLAEPQDWQSHYKGDTERQHLLRVYSYSDRIRYYWHKTEISASVNRLIANLRETRIPEVMLSRYLPLQYSRVSSGMIPNEPVALVIDKIQDVLRAYAAACPAA